MAGYLKKTLGVKSLVTNGNEGYRAAGTYDPYAPVTYPCAPSSPCYPSPTQLQPVLPYHHHWCPHCPAWNSVSVALPPAMTRKQKARKHRTRDHMLMLLLGTDGATG